MPTVALAITTNVQTIVVVVMQLIVKNDLQGTLQIHPMRMDGECYKNNFNVTSTSYYYNKVTQQYKGTYPASASCISYCTGLYHKTYKYAAMERGGSCYCGAAKGIT